MNCCLIIEVPEKISKDEAKEYFMGALKAVLKNFSRFKEYANVDVEGYPDLYDVEEVVMNTLVLSLTDGNTCTIQVGIECSLQFLDLMELNFIKAILNYNRMWMMLSISEGIILETRGIFKNGIYLGTYDFVATLRSEKGEIDTLYIEERECL